MKRARQFFRAALRLRIISENPFTDVPSPAQGDEKPVEYVFGKAEKTADSRRMVVPYAARQDFERNGKYPLKMQLMNDGNAKGRYYIVSGN